MPDNNDNLTEPEAGLLAKVITAADLHHLTFPPLAQFVPGLVVEGFGIVAGPPKLGKSWWTLNLALGVADGGTVFGKIKVPARDVLLLALEDSHRRVQSRIREVWGQALPPSRLHILTDLNPGLLLPTVTEWLEDHAGGLVILDTLGRARPQRRRGDDPYLADYQAGVALKNAVDAFPGSALLGVHHTRKASSDDFVDDLSGTLGLAGSADYILVLRRARNSNDANLQITGRDAPEGEYAFTVAAGTWTLAGDSLAGAAAEAQQRRETKNLGDRNLDVLALVNSRSESTRAADVVEKLGMKEGQARVYLNRLADSDRICRVGRGAFGPLIDPNQMALHETDIDAVTSVTSVTNSEEVQVGASDGCAENVTPSAMSVTFSRKPSTSKKIQNVTVITDVTPLHTERVIPGSVKASTPGQVDRVQQALAKALRAADAAIDGESA